MNSDLRTLVRQSDPIQELDASPVTADATDTLFQSIVMRRGTTMTTDQHIPTDQQQPDPRKQGSGWLVAAGVFSVVVIAAAAAFLLAGQADDAAPAAPITAPATPTTATPTTATSTTTIASAGYLGAVEVAEAAIAALNTYEAEAVHGVSGAP
ncbi:MAG: hypothetical protein ACR2N2_01670, partial [Acidimicrobiia bacterium]